MSEPPVAVQALIDVESGGVLLANMLAGWLDANGESSFSVEVADEYHDQRAAPEQDCVCVCASVDAGAGTAPSGEHGASVCSAGESTGHGLERTVCSDSGRGSGQVRSTDNESGGLQDSGSGSLDGSGGGSFCVGSFATGAFEFGLASIAGAVCTDRYAGDRRRWLLQSGRFQRWPSAGLKGDYGAGRTPFVARAPPWWQAQ